MRVRGWGGRQVMQDLVGCEKDFYFGEGGSHRRFRAKEGCALTQLLTGALWQLWRKETGEVRAGVGTRVEAAVLVWVSKGGRWARRQQRKWGK